MSDGRGPEPSGGSEYTVVLRANSSAYFLPEEGWEHHFSLPDPALGTVRTRTFTRWVTEGSTSIPRELVIEVKGCAGSLDEVGARFSMIARPIANKIAFVANVRVGPIEAHLAFDGDPDRTEGRFLEVFLPDGRGDFSSTSPKNIRTVKYHLLWPGKAQVSWMPCICAPASRPPNAAAAWVTSP